MLWRQMSHGTSQHPANHTDNGELVFDYFSDCVFIVDVVLSFVTTFKEDGAYVTDRLALINPYKYLTLFFHDIYHTCTFDCPTACPRSRL